MSPFRRKKASAPTDASERFPAAPLDGALLEVEDVKTHFRTDRGIVRAVDGVSFSLERGKTIGIVGESGSGKTVLSRSIMGLLPKQNVIREGSIQFEGKELIDASGGAVKTAIVMHFLNASRAEAERALEEGGGVIRRIVNRPPPPVRHA